MLNIPKKDDWKITRPNCKRWVFDIFYDGQYGKPKIDISWDLIWRENQHLIKYLVVEAEIGKKRGKHWQGYLELHKKQRRRPVQILLTGKNEQGKPVIEHYADKALYSAMHNTKYCSKDYDKGLTKEFYKFGEPSNQNTGQGKRNDILRCKDMIKNGCKMLDVANFDFGSYCKYHVGFGKYQNMIEEESRQNRRDVKSYLLSGPTGSRKTTWVMDKFGDNNVYICDFSKGEWWNSYKGEDVILFDDYNNDLRINRMLRLMDRFKCRLATKGGFVWANWTKVYITTNLKIGEIHPKAKLEHRRAFFRRVRLLNLPNISPIIYSNNSSKVDSNIVETSELINQRFIRSSISTPYNSLWNITPKTDLLSFDANSIIHLTVEDHKGVLSYPQVSFKTVTLIEELSNTDQTIEKSYFPFDACLT